MEICNQNNLPPPSPSLLPLPSLFLHNTISTTRATPAGPTKISWTIDAAVVVVVVSVAIVVVVGVIAGVDVVVVITAVSAKRPLPSRAVSSAAAFIFATSTTRRPTTCGPTTCWLEDF